MQKRNIIALALVGAAILAADFCIPFAAGCVSAALILTSYGTSSTT